MAYRKQPARTYRRDSGKGRTKQDELYSGYLTGKRALLNADDLIQAEALRGYARVADMLPDEREGMKNRVMQWGERMHRNRNEFANTIEGQAELAAIRALQAGGVTLAGAGLVNLTHRLANAFGGPADEPSQGALYL